MASQYPQNCRLHSAYADDVHAAESSTNVRMAAKVNPHLTFHQHPKILEEQTTERLKNLKPLVGSNWCQQKDTIIMTYKAFIWSMSAGQMLQTVQNTAMRIVTGCHQRTLLDHLHAETQLLPVIKSLQMV